MQDYQIIFDDKNWGAWSIDPKLAHELIGYLEREKPRSILETGSGITSVIFGIYKKRHNAHVISLEHDERYFDINQRKLDKLGLEHKITLEPLFKRSDGYWYGQDRYEVDFCLIDGPPEAYGRGEVLNQIDAKVYWLDDANRPHEQKLLEKWGREYHLVNLSFKGTAVIKSLDELDDYTDLTVCILTGHRPELLKRTIDSLLDNAPGLLDMANVIVHHNDAPNDPKTTKVLESYRFTKTVFEQDKMLSIGESISSLFSRVPNK